MFPYSNLLKSSTFAFLAKNYDLISSIPYPCKLLDFGCSSGKTTKMMANFSNITEILGLDQHSDIVAVAECFNSNRRVSFDVADLEDFHSLPKPSENRFHLVTSFFSLDEFENVEEVLRNIYKCLHRYGYLVGKLFGRKTKAHMDMEEWIAKNRLKVKEIVPNNGHFNSLWTTSKDPALEIHGLLEKCEFEKVQCEYSKENIVMNKEEIKGIAGFLP